jgi:hypothetical protein
MHFGSPFLQTNSWLATLALTARKDNSRDLNACQRV